MILFKAIRHTDEAVLSSVFKGEYRNHSSISELISSAMSHIKVANQKRKKRSADYWFSATNDFYTALRYLNDHQDDEYKYNGIAIIELPNTLESGFIYDDVLRENGYIDKKIIENEIVCNWKCNDDGIVWLLDMSSRTTINYLASVLWLKGNDTTFRDFRVLRTSNKDHEFLILGENIKYSFIDMDTANNLSNQLSGLENCIANKHNKLFQVFLDNAPEGKFKTDLFSKAQRSYFNEEEEYDDYLSYEIDVLRQDAIDRDSYWGDDFLDINEMDLKRRVELNRKDRKDREIHHFYSLVEGIYSEKRAIKRFSDFHMLNYRDKDIIDFAEYEPIRKVNYVDFEIALAAYIYSGLNMYGVMQEQNTVSVLAHLYKNEFPEVFSEHQWLFLRNFCPRELYLGIFKDEGK